MVNDILLELTNCRFLIYGSYIYIYIYMMVWKILPIVKFGYSCGYVLEIVKLGGMVDKYLEN